MITPLFLIKMIFTMVFVGLFCIILSLTVDNKIIQKCVSFMAYTSICVSVWCMIILIWI